MSVKNITKTSIKNNKEEEKVLRVVVTQTVTHEYSLTDLMSNSLFLDEDDENMVTNISDIYRGINSIDDSEIECWVNDNSLFDDFFNPGMDCNVSVDFEILK